ncbi:MAG TPA: peroxiredoxin [Steroidobacteraceae bacterium]|nr:peroxiredoxin [Steroidobacteraceae bacterium]
MRIVMNRSLASLAATVLALAFAAGAHGAAVVGSPAPAFKLQDQDGKWHSLSDYSGQWLVLYFYPKDMTPGCTTQACDFRDNIFAFKKAGVAVLGVSVDDVESHQKFAEKHGLPFPILADSTKQTARDYGVLTSFLGLKFARRETFIVDPHGRIAKHYAQVEPKGHSQVVLRDLEALRNSAT